MPSFVFSLIINNFIVNYLVTSKIIDIPSTIQINVVEIIIVLNLTDFNHLLYTKIPVKVAKLDNNRNSPKNSGRNPRTFV